MIFKTITNESTGAIKSIGLFGKTTNELKKSFSDIKTNGLINTFFNISSIDENAITEYNREIKKATANSVTMWEKQQMMKTAMEGTNKATAQLIGSTKGAIVETETLAAAQKQSTLIAKAGQVALSAFATAGNMAAGVFVAVVASKALQNIERYINRVKYAKEALNDFHNTTQESKSRLVSQKEWIAKNGTTYERLSKGVDEYGHAVSLTTEEFSEYNSMTNEIAEMFPNMVKGYNDQSRALLKNKGSVDALTESYRENEKAYYASIRSTSGKTFTDYKTGIKKEKETVDILGKLINNDIDTSLDFRDPATLSSNFSEVLPKDTYEQFEKEIGNKFTKLGTYGVTYLTFDFSKLSSDLQQKIIDIYNTANTTIDTETEKVRPILEAYLYGASSGYDSLEPDAQQAVQGFINNIGSTFYSQFDNDSDLESWIKKNVITPLQDGISNSDLAIKFQTLFSLDENNFDSYQSYVDAAQDILNSLSKMTDKDGEKLFTQKQIDSFAMNIGIADYDINGNVTGQNLIDHVKEKFAGIKGSGDLINGLHEKELNILRGLEPDEKTSLADLKAFIRNKLKMESQTSSAPHLSFSQAWNNLKSVDEGENVKDVTSELLNLAKAGEISDATLKSNAEYKTLIKDTGLTAREARYEIMSMVSVQDKMAGFQSKMESIATLYNEFKDKGFVTAGTLDELPDVFKEMNGGKDFDLFSKIAGDPTSGREKIKEAFGDIVTAYIQDQDILVGATNKTRDSVVANLKDAGVTNAAEVVDSYLNSMNLIQNAEKEFSNKSAQQRAADISNFQKALKDKNTSFSDACNVLGKNNAALMTSMGKQYADDYINWLKAIDRKKNAYNKFVKAYNKATNYKDNKSSVYEQTQKGADGASAASIFAGIREKKRIADEAKRDEKKEKEKLTKYKTIDFELDPADYKPKNISGASNSKKTDKDNTKSTQIIDWISRRLEVLQSAIDTTKAKFENLFNFKAQKNNLNKQIAQTIKLLNAQTKAAEKYQKKANSVKLSDGLKKKAQNGDITGSLSELIATYGDKKANQITKYQDYLDKANNARKEIQSLRTELKALKDQADQLYVDRADQHISTLDAEGELIQSAKGKNELERKKIKWVKQSYDYQIKIAKREKDSVKVAQLRAQKEKEILDIKKQILQNALDENNAIRENAEARYQNATTVNEKSSILDAKIAAYQSDMAKNNSYYNGRKADIETNGLGSQSVPDDIKKSLKASNVKEANQKKILNCIKSGKKIPDNLLNLENVQNNSELLWKLINYNSDMTDKINEELNKLALEQDTANQENTANIRNTQADQLQLYADDHKAKYDLLQLQEDNAISAKDKNALESQSLQELKEQYAYELAIAKLKGDVTEQARIQAEWEAKWTDSYQKQYNNIKTEYDNVIKLNEAKISTTQAQISALEAQGKTISEGMYRDLMSQTAENHKKLIEERNALAASMSGMAYGSDEYYAARQDLEALDQAILQCNGDLAGFQDNINKLNLSLFDRKESFIDSQIDYLEYLTDIISHSDLTGKDAYGLTDAGFATISLYLDEIEKYKEKALNARDAAAELQRQFDSGEYNGSWEDAQEDIQSYLDTEREAIKSTLKFKDSIKSLVKEAFDIQLDSLNELIDKRKKALQTEKNLYDYQRKIADQNKEIASIEKQMAALTGDNSEETRATMQKLKISLEDAKQDLEDTKYDKWISDQEDMLDSMSEDLSDMFESVLNNTDKLIESVETAVNNNGGLLNQIFEKMGYGNPDDMKKTENEDGSIKFEYADVYGNNITLHVDKDGNIMSDKDGDGVYESDASGQEQFTPPPKSQTAPQPEPLPEIQVPDYANDGLLYRDIPDETVSNDNLEKINQLATAKATINSELNGAQDGYKWKQKDFKNSPLAQQLKIALSLLGYSNLDTTNDTWGSGLTDAITFFKSFHDFTNLNGDLFGKPFLQSLLNELNNITFSTGGIAHLQSGILRKTGEDGWVLARNGEGFVRPEDVPQIQALLNTVPTVTSLMNGLSPFIHVPSLSAVHGQNSVNVGDVNIHLDGSNVTDPQSFVNTVRQSREVQKAIQDATIGQVVKPYNNRLTI